MPRGGERLLRFWFTLGEPINGRHVLFSRLCRTFTSLGLSVVLNIFLVCRRPAATPDPSSPHLLQLG